MVPKIQRYLRIKAFILALSTEVGQESDRSSDLRELVGCRNVGSGEKLTHRWVLFSQANHAAVLLDRPLRGFEHADHAKAGISVAERRALFLDRGDEFFRHQSQCFTVVKLRSQHVTIAITNE